MTLSVETLLIVSLMMAVFAAVSVVGSSLFLGVGFERLRNGFEGIKKQTAFFSNAIHDLDQRVESVEKQNGYFFETINKLETQSTATSENTKEGEHLIITDTRENTKSQERLLTDGFGGSNQIHFH